MILLFLTNIILHSLTRGKLSVVERDILDEWIKYMMDINDIKVDLIGQFIAIKYHNYTLFIFYLFFIELMFRITAKSGKIYIDNCLLAKYEIIFYINIIVYCEINKI